MRLKDMLFGGYTPPPVPGRLVSNDDAPKRRSDKSVKAISTFVAKTRVRQAQCVSKNAERIKAHLVAHPWSTANELCQALGLTKTPVYNYLARFKHDAKVDVGVRKVGVHTLVSYRWRDD